MSQKEDVKKFFRDVCQNQALQDQLKPPCPASRQGFADVAQQWGYTFTPEDIDNYVRFYAFYKEFQAAIDKHQSGSEELSDWLKTWQKHIQRYDQVTSDDDQDTIRRYI